MFLYAIHSCFFFRCFRVIWHTIRLLRKFPHADKNKISKVNTFSGGRKNASVQLSKRPALYRYSILMFLNFIIKKKKRKNIIRSTRLSVLKLIVWKLHVILKTSSARSSPREGWSKRHLNVSWLRVFLEIELCLRLYSPIVLCIVAIM